MSPALSKKPTMDETRIGECAAMQPLSGILRVEASGAVIGNGHGAFVRKETADKNRERR